MQFAFEHDDVLIRGFLDMLHSTAGRALVVDYKTNALEESSPQEIVDQEYRLQRLVYALACFRSGATEVEVVYHFLERADAVVPTLFTTADVPALETELSAAIARIQGRGVRADAERVRLRRLPGAGRRLRRPPASQRATAAGDRLGSLSLTCDHLVTYYPGQ